MIKSIKKRDQHSIFQKEKTEATTIPKVHFMQSLTSGYWLSFPRRFQGFAIASLLRNFFFGIALREKGRERHEGFSFRDTMQSLMASLITCRRQIHGLNPKYYIASINIVLSMSKNYEKKVNSNPLCYTSGGSIVY